VNPVGEARPAWKVLRVLGNLLDLPDFDYLSSEQVRDELASACEGVTPDNRVQLAGTLELRSRCAGLMRIGDIPIYAQDALVRRATALQQTQDAQPAMVRINPAEAKKRDLATVEAALVTQNGSQAKLPLELDERVPDGCIWISAALAGTEMLGEQFGEVTLEKA
jgi:NADH-quinone oxidoreductase subunit G